MLVELDLLVEAESCRVKDAHLVGQLEVGWICQEALLYARIKIGLDVLQLVHVAVRYFDHVHVVVDRLDHFLRLFELLVFDILNG